MWVRGGGPIPGNGKLRMSTDKPMPIASIPDHWSAFNGHDVHRAITRFLLQQTGHQPTTPTAERSR